jgi:hypothetical protein
MTTVLGIADVACLPGAAVAKGPAEASISDVDCVSSLEVLIV